jgi:hypothetical protein
MAGDGTEGDTKDTTKDDAKDANAGSDATKATDKTDVDKSKDKQTDDLSGLKKALAAERKLREGLEKEKRDAELSKLPELEKAQTLVKDLTDQNEKLTKENLRLTVAMDLGLPWKIGKRLSGDTEEEMRADGADLLKDYKPDDTKVIKDDPKNKRPANDAKKTGGSGGPSMNDLLRAAAGRRAT